MDLDSLNPNVALLLTTAVTTLLTFLWRKATGAKQADWRSLVGSLADQALHQLELTPTTTLEQIRKSIAGYIRDGLERAGIKGGAVIDGLVNGAVEAGTTKALDYVRDAAIEKNMAAAAAQMKATLPGLLKMLDSEEMKKALAPIVSGENVRVIDPHSDEHVPVESTTPTL